MSVKKETVGDGVLNASGHSSNLRILVVEDHAGLARLMGLALESLGHAVRTAGGVNAALELAAQEQFDLLVSDLGLPDGSGLDLMRQLAGRQIKGIAFSGYDDEEHIRAARAAGFAAHLKKPVEMEDLAATIERVLSQSESPKP
jgi:CheY-like chemotaxis protein